MSGILGGTRKFYVAACAVLLAAALALGAAASAVPRQSGAPEGSASVDYDAFLESVRAADEGDILYRKTPAEGGIPVEIRTDQTQTFSVKTKDNIPTPAYYPLPQGTLDYLVGKELKCRDSEGVIRKYRLLASGVRVETKNLKKASEGPKNNAITSLSVSAPNDGYTYITLDMKQKVAYSVAYRGDSFQVLFHYTVSAPKSAKLSSNPMFTQAKWEDDCKLTLSLVRKNRFMGYKAYYDKNGNLVFRFNNPPKSIKNAVIAIDPGHGGKDFGALGTNKNWPEKIINASISKKLEAELLKRGAKVHLLKTAGYQKAERVAIAAKVNPDILISVHSNTAPSKTAAGTETYYFYPFSYRLAENCAANVSKQMATNNRKARQSYYHITLSPEFASVLLETGFMSNATEYKKLRNSKYQDRVAKGIADSIEGAIQSAYTGSAASGATAVDPAPDLDGEAGTDITENETETENGDGGDTTSSSSDANVEDVNDVPLKQAGEVYLYEDYIRVYPGSSHKIQILSEDDKTVRNSDFKWESDDTSIATVSKYGVVKARKTGDATITATSGDWKLECVIEVSKETSKVTSVQLDKSSVTLSVGKTQDIKATIQPRSASSGDIQWISSNERIATVDSNGRVKGIKRGTVTVTARARSDRNISAECTVEVVRGEVDIDYIDLDDGTLEYAVGDADQLTFVTEPENVADDALVWTSSRPEVVSVDSKGNVKALKAGKAVITLASAKNKKIYDECEITVYE